jgi:hypothetical protein
VGEPSLVVGAALGECVHTAGVLNFLAAARRAGYRTEFLGPAVSVPLVVEAAAARRPELLALSYRLTPEAAERLFARLGEALAEAGLAGQRLVFGGTPVVAEVAARCGLFEAVFGGAGGPSAEEFLSGQRAGSGPAPGAQSLVERCREAAPRPLIRHHFGLPDLESTVEGIGRIAAAGVVDVVSLGPDQNFQEHFFHPERMDPAQDGAGGVPVRHPDDLRRLYQATRQGNHPLMRCYSGTNDQVALAEVLHDTIHNAWCAVPVFWYSELDGRSQRPLETAIAEHSALVGWCARRGVPVERNDQNQWGLRQASDVVQVAAAALAAGLSAAAGVTTCVLQMMLNNPPGISPAMDVAKMAAMEALVRARVGSGVTLLRQTRGGLFSMPLDQDRARGQLAAAVRTGMLLHPDIIHVVGHTEAHHAPNPGRGGPPPPPPPRHRPRRADRRLHPGAPGRRRCPPRPARSPRRPGGGRSPGPPGGGGLPSAGRRRGALPRRGGGRPGGSGGSGAGRLAGRPLSGGEPGSRRGHGDGGGRGLRRRRPGERSPTVGEAAAGRPLLAAPAASGPAGASPGAGSPGRRGFGGSQPPPLPAAGYSVGAYSAGPAGPGRDLSCLHASGTLCHRPFGVLLVCS